MKLTLLLLSAAVLASPAADTKGFTYWSSADLKSYQQKLAPKVNEHKMAMQQLADWGNHFAAIAHREADGEAELHEKVSDVFVVQTGEATLVYGGEVVNGKTTAPNEIRGPSIKGGQRRKLAPGDIVHIPSRTPHQLFVENGKQFTYFFVKVKGEK